jgi:hypothetical protein
MVDLAYQGLAPERLFNEEDVPEVIFGQKDPH